MDDNDLRRGDTGEYAQHCDHMIQYPYQFEDTTRWHVFLKQRVLCRVHQCLSISHSHASHSRIATGPISAFASLFVGDWPAAHNTGMLRPVFALSGARLGRLWPAAGRKAIYEVR